MYPDLSYFFDGFGAETDGVWSILKTYGVCLMLAFLVAGYMLYAELKRREREGSLKAKYKEVVVSYGFQWIQCGLQALYGFILAGKLAYLIAHRDLLAEKAGYMLFSLNVDYIWGVVGAAMAAGYYYYSTYRVPTRSERVSRAIYPSDRVLTIVLLASFCGVLGARILALLEHPEPFFRDPIKALISTGGMSVYGGMLLGLVVLTFYLRYLKIPLLQMLDSAAPSVFVAYGIGRLGCHFSGDGDWGIVSNPDGWYSFLPDVLVAETFPHNVAGRGVELPGCVVKFCNVLPEGVFPTSLYEFILAIVLGALLWSWQKKWARWPGLLFAVYLVISGTERLLIEMIRVNDRYDFMGFQLSQAQHIAIGYIICGSIFVLYFRRKYGGSFGL